jgi:hypothetical protein
MRTKVLLLALVLLVIPAVGGASEWREMFTANGTGSDRESGCDSAKAGVWSAFGYASACMMRQGWKADEEFKECSCQKLEFGDTAVYNCSVRVVVTCENKK